MYSGLFFLRFAVAVVFIHHSIPKLKDPKSMASGMGWGYGQVLGLGLLEFMSAIALLSGLAARAGAFALMLVMCGAIYHKMKKWNVPFMSHNSTGWELDFVLLLANLTIYLSK